MTVVIPTLETERLILRPWYDGDVDGFAALMADAEISRYVGGPLSRDDAWRKMATYVGHWLLRGYGTFALELRATRQFVGYCGPWFPLGWPEREIAWGIIPAEHGQGFATEAARRALTFAYEDLGWDTAVSVISTANTPSIRVAERLGAVRGEHLTVRSFPVDVWRHLPPVHRTG